MDMVFSSDDSMLATASGDQSSRIIDMRTQKTKFIMHEHTTSVKQVRFQPGNDNIIATSSRDGSVQMWDMRCRADEVMVSETTRSLDLTPANELNVAYKAFGASTYNSIYGAHVDRHALNELTQR
jgi:WD40 repeat protein